MNVETICARCHEWVPVQGTELCLDCGRLICPACRPTHTARQVAGRTVLTCQPHTDEDVARLMEGE